MYLEINNIGKINSASIKLDGMTVIAGENNTGKSTISKALFSSFNCLYNYENKVYEAKQSAITRLLYRYITNIEDKKAIQSNFLRNRDIIFEEFKPVLVPLIVNFKDKISDSNFETIVEMIKNYIEENSDVTLLDNSKSLVDSEDLKDLKKSINESLSVPNNEILNRIATNFFGEEFDSQINNIYSKYDGEIKLKIKKDQTIFQIKNHIVSDVLEPVSLKTQAIYIDDPFVFDDKFFYLRHFNKNDHRTLLKERLLEENDSDYIEQIVVDKKIDQIFKKLDSVANGDLVFDARKSAEYRPSVGEESIRMRNVSSGLKTFIIIKKLLQNGTLEKNGTLILDEPEIHLHPQWQILLAELIVLIQKEFDMHILLTTHSPYFLYAVEVFTAKHGMKNKSNYYLADNIDDKLELKFVTDSVDLIYKKLSEPFQNLENLSYE